MALTPCRECGKEVSTAAAACPHCGAPSLLKPKPKGRGGCLGLAVLLIGGIILISMIPATPPTLEEAAKKKQDDAEFSADYDALNSAGSVIVMTGDANKFEISGFHTSLDLYLPSLQQSQALSLANFLCYRNFSSWKSRRQWSVRVYLVDGKLAAECPIRRAGP